MKNRMADSVDPDEMALDLHCLQKCLSNIVYRAERVKFYRRKAFFSRLIVCRQCLEMRTKELQYNIYLKSMFSDFR